MKKIVLLVLIFCSLCIVVSAQTKNKKATTTFGKYGCTASKYNNGSYAFIPKGAITLTSKGTYTYFGFENPSNGNMVINDKGEISFKGGYLNGGKATPIEDRPNRYYLVSPTIPDGRWTCGLKD